jgi:leader peptidase (prepilin peptidase)/N-methyltransferase
MYPLDSTIYLIVSAVMGLIVGSFLNVVISRTKLGSSFAKGRSRCLHCKHRLGVWDLIPLLSFIFLLGRCRYCGKRISVQYPLVELITSLVFVGFALNNTNIWEVLLLWAISSVFIVIAVYDLKHFLILDKFTFFGFALVVVYAFIKDALLSGLLGAAIISGFFLFQYFISKGRWIGFGDVKFGLLMGMVTGFPLAILSLFMGYVSGALVGIALIGLKKKHLSSRLPFGTFLAFATIFALLYGQEILTWYLELIGFPQT